MMNKTQKAFEILKKLEKLEQNNSNNFDYVNGLVDGLTMVNKADTTEIIPIYGSGCSCGVKQIDC